MDALIVIVMLTLLGAGFGFGYSAGKSAVLIDLQVYGMYADKDYEFHVTKGNAPKTKKED